MSSRIPLVLTVIAVLVAVAGAHAGSPIEQVTEQITAMAANPKLVQAVKEQNKRNVSRAEIERLDQEWQAGKNTLSDEVLARPCSKQLQDIVKGSDGLYREIFVADNEGANVCMDKRTTYYDHGKMEKWTAAFNGGKGGTYVGARTLDKSSNSFEQQISVPVLDKGKVIGVITVGVDMAQFKH
jgi:hypothetical protein